LDWLAEIDKIIRAVEARSHISATELNALLPSEIDLTSRQIEDLLNALQDHGVSVDWEDV
jgi:hypothetical protein